MRLKLHWQILIALISALIAGVASHDPSQFLVTYQIFDFVGTLFLNALTMLIVPLLILSIICQIANSGSQDGLGQMGGKTIACYLSTILLSILTGLILAVDRVLDMCRTVDQVFSDCCGAVIIARSEGEEGVLSA